MSRIKPHQELGLMTTPEVSRAFGVVCSTVVSWAAKGLIPHTRTPTGRLRFHRDDVERLLAEGRPT